MIAYWCPISTPAHPYHVLISSIYTCLALARFQWLNSSLLHPGDTSRVPLAPPLRASVLEQLRYSVFAAAV